MSRLDALRMAIEVAKLQLSHGFADVALETLAHALKADDNLRVVELRAKGRFDAGLPPVLPRAIDMDGDLS